MNLKKTNLKKEIIRTITKLDAYEDLDPNSIDIKAGMWRIEILKVKSTLLLGLLFYELLKGK